jgi:triosephosphate isomerase
MKHESLLYFANWKMSMPSLEHAKFFGHELARETKEVRDSVIICPSTIHLYPLTDHFKEYGLHFGAQNCSEHAVGAYTGETAAQSIKELSVQFCLVGHSERRKHFHETDAIVANKVEQLIANHINPVICIGETEEEHTQKKTFEALTMQLKPIIADLTLSAPWPHTIYIAYEPVWAIGTGKTADSAYIQEVFSWIKKYCAMHLPIDMHLVLLYGGSVDPISVQSLKKIENIGGFLIGSASLDFQKFKKIVL